MKTYDKYKPSGIPWIGQIPEHWEVKRIKAITTSISKGNGISKEQVIADGDVPCVRYGEIYAKYTHSFTKCISKTKLEELTTPRYFTYGDILCAGTGELTEEIGKSIVYLGKEKCLAGGDIIILKHTQNPAFLNYAFNSDYAQNQKSCGKAKLKVVHISSCEIGNVNIILPPLSEQEAIVSYLDGKTARIDQLLALYGRQEQLLAELKQTTIAHAVTHGLNPNTPTKPTNIPWLNEIPQHWEVKRNKSFLKPTEEVVGDRKDEFTLLSLTKQGVIIRDLSERKGKFPKEYDSYLVVRPDNIVFCLFDMDETPRTVGLVKNVGMLTGAYTNFEINQKMALPEYVYYFYEYIDDIKGMKPYYSGLRKVVKRNTFLQLNIPLPPLSEQQEIVAYINEKCEKIDRQITSIRRQIELLQEYKQRLIADLVTGHFKPNGEAQ